LLPVALSSLVGRERVERPHVVETIGQFDDDDACVLRDREQQLAVALDLPLLLRSTRRKLGDLGETVDDAGDFLPELLLDVGDRDSRIFDDIVDQPTGNRDGVEL